MTFIGWCLLIMGICGGIRAYQDKKLRDSNPRAWLAKKAHEEETKARKRQMLGKTGFEVARWLLRK